MITVACVWVKGNVPYGVEYVANLRAMVAKHLTRDHRFVCLTDRPGQLPGGIEAISITLPKGLFGWWGKIELFRARRFEGRVLYLDLDTLVVRSLDPIADYPSPFALVPHAGTFTGAYKGKVRRIVPRFNSSVMVWDASEGVSAQLHRPWTAEVADDLHGDQDWIGQQMPHASAMPAAWFPRLSEIEVSGPFAHDRGIFVPKDARVILSKKPKNHIAADLWPWFAKLWRAA